MPTSSGRNMANRRDHWTGRSLSIPAGEGRAIFQVSHALTQWSSRQRAGCDSRVGWTQFVVDPGVFAGAGSPGLHLPSCRQPGALDSVAQDIHVIVRRECGSASDTEPSGRRESMSGAACARTLCMVSTPG